MNRPSPYTIKKRENINKIKNVPDKIYLQITKDEIESSNNDFNNLNTKYITCCKDRINDTDIEYIRDNGGK